jgi:hypothetical protein
LQPWSREIVMKLINFNKWNYWSKFDHKILIFKVYFPSTKLNDMFGDFLTDDIELVRGKREAPETPNLKKSRSLGGSLKKLFRRGRKQTRSRGETSRESSFSRSSTRNVSQGPSREGSLNRNVDPKDMQYQQTLIS